MEEFLLDHHSILCKKDVIDYFKLSPRQMCEMNQNHVIFFAANKFFILNYWQCMSYNHADFMKENIQNILEKYEIMPFYVIRGKQHIGYDVKKFAKDNSLFKKQLRQTNYIYKDATGKMYGITTQTQFLDVLCNQDELKENYKKAIEYIKKRGYEYLRNDLDLLYSANCIYGVDDVKIVKSVDELIKGINQLTK
jgi:hypothetical protein